MTKLLFHKETEKKILNRAKECNENNQNRIRDQRINKYKGLSNEKKKDLKREYGKDRYQNVPEENKRRLENTKKNYLFFL